MENQQHLAQLFQKYLENDCSPAEAEELLRLMQSPAHQAEFQNLIHKQLDVDNHMDLTTAEAIQRVYSRLKLERKPGFKPLPTRKLYTRIAAAVVLVLSLSAGLIYLQFVGSSENATPPQISSHDVLPGGNKATLKLANGQTITLSADQNGIVAGEEITYFDGSSVLGSGGDGDLHPDYDADRLQDPNAQLLSLSTPNGGTYRIELPDGTRVWLNAASTLKYPAQFDTEERVVYLDGEAYFDVNTLNGDGKIGTTTSAIPFKVISSNQTVEVFGTEFNVAAYANEQETRTTLVEGLVRVTDGRSPVTLLPGQQAQVGTRGIRVIQANIETAIDWKNGDFIFEDEELNSIMRKLARWYNVEVIFENELSDERYSAHISRQRNLSEIMHILELSGNMNSRIADNRLYLSPK